tara:strand:- start:454 stop:825 length:372 start_codon:yes stop_codon:yes gene_type:complete
LETFGLYKIEQQERWTDNSASNQWLGWIADNGSSRRHILCHNGTHTNDSALTDHQRLVWRALFDDRTRTNIRMVMDMDIAVTTHSWRESYVIAYHAIMPHITVCISMEATTDLDIASNIDKGT